MTLFPMFLKLEGRSCLVVGAGAVGESKVRSLLDAEARVHVVAPRAGDAVKEWAHAGVITWEERSFELSDLDDTFLVIVATSSPVVNEFVFHESRRRGVLCNIVDDPERCDFYYPAVVRRGQFQIAISTGGQSPALAQRVRRELEEQFGPEYAAWVEELGRERQELLSTDLDPDHRRKLLHALVSQQSFEAKQCASRRKRGIS